MLKTLKTWVRNIRAEWHIRKLRRAVNARRKRDAKRSAKDAKRRHQGNGPDWWGDG